MHLALSTASWDRKIDGKGKPFLLPCCTLNLTILNQDSMKQLIVFFFFFLRHFFLISSTAMPGSIFACKIHCAIKLIAVFLARAI